MLGTISENRSTLLICLALFLAAFAVRVIIWQNNKIEMATVQSGVTLYYISDARTLATGDLKRFLVGPAPPSDANVISHPPGYPVLMAAVFATVGEGTAFHIIQLVINSLASVLIFLIAVRLFEHRVAITAGVLTAIAPQFGYHSGLLLPDELSVLPLLLAVYFLIRAQEEWSWQMLMLCGASIALSCWLRSNAMLVPVYFSIAALFLLTRRWLSAGLIIAASLIIISPVTVRNIAIFNAITPLSLGGGTTFVEGLGDLDPDSTLPQTDEDVMRLDEQLAGLPPNTYTALYSPEGVTRDRARFRFGLSTVADRPAWYIGGVAKRGLTTFRLERVPAIEPTRDERDTTPALLYYLNRPLKLLQRAFITAIFLPLSLIGLVIAAWRKRTDVIPLLILPLYYATVQALIHTEYRYVLATPHMLMIFAAVALAFAFESVIGIIRRPDVTDAAGAE